MTKLTMTGGPELERALKELGGQIAGRLGANAARAGGREIVKAAKARAPVKTGRLKGSIRVFSGTKRQGSTIEIAVGSDVFYARLLEFGTAHIPAKSFLRAAADEQGQQAVDKMAKNLRDGVEREATKLGRR